MRRSTTNTRSPEVRSRYIRTCSWPRCRLTDRCNVYAEFEIENLDDSDLSIGSWSFTCYADDYVCDETYFDDDSLSVIDSISAGKKIKGKVYYEVPENTN